MADVSGAGHLVLSYLLCRLRHGCYLSVRRRNMQTTKAMGSELTRSMSKTRKSGYMVKVPLMRLRLMRINMKSPKAMTRAQRGSNRLTMRNRRTMNQRRKMTSRQRVLHSQRIRTQGSSSLASQVNPILGDLATRQTDWCTHDQDTNLDGQSKPDLTGETAKQRGHGDDKPVGDKGTKENPKVLEHPDEGEDKGTRKVTYADAKGGFKKRIESPRGKAQGELSDEDASKEKDIDPVRGCADRVQKQIS